MDELARLMDWDLQAIVRGCTSEETPAATIMDNLHLNYSHLCSDQQQDLLLNFHEFSKTTSVVDELEELYKPFYPVLNNPISIVTSPQPILEETEEVKVLKHKPADKTAKEPAASKCKRRYSKKNQNKRVKHVTEAEGFRDGWAWRKYGQKPIKGSPFPRSYYKCSSSKGCFARKQVERSHSDPNVFIVTYTAEHNHPHPTRRKNSQAGSTRKNASSTTIASSRMVEYKSIEDGHVPSVGQQSGGVEKEDDCADLLEDVEGGNWFPSIELEEELNVLDGQSLGLDGCGFIDTSDETWFNSSIDLT